MVRVGVVRCAVVRVGVVRCTVIRLVCKVHCGEGWCGEVHCD